MSARPIRSAVAASALGLALTVGVFAGAAAVPSTASAPPSPRSEVSGTPYPVTPFEPQAADPARMRAAWREWRGRRLGHYATVVKRTCYCPDGVPVVRTEVRSAQVVSVTDRRTRRDVRQRGYEITGLYRLVRRGYREADEVSVTYRHGVPAHIDIDWDVLLADEETVLDVTVSRLSAAAPYPIRTFRPRASDPDRLVHAWRAWRDRRPTRYTTVVRQYCFCGEVPPLRTEVRRRHVVSVRHLDHDRELRRHGYEVPVLYRLLRRAFAEADGVRVRFRRGVPARISIDWDRRASDEEIRLTVHLREL